jgi:peptide/nickel transport system ATP-binding protein
VILRPQDPYTRELRAASPDPENHFGAFTAQTAGGAL